MVAEEPANLSNLSWRHICGAAGQILRKSHGMAAEKPAKFWTSQVYPRSTAAEQPAKF